MALSVCLFVLVGCAASVAADGYSKDRLAYNYPRPQMYYAPVQPAYGYVGTGGGMSGGLGLQSNVGGLLPIILIFVVLSIAAPALIGSLQSIRGGTSEVLGSRSLD